MAEESEPRLVVETTPDPAETKLANVESAMFCELAKAASMDRLGDGFRAIAARFEMSPEPLPLAEIEVRMEAERHREAQGEPEPVEAPCPFGR